MRAAVISEPGGPEVFRIQDIDEPAPGPEEVLVDVKATALNRADLLQRQRALSRPAGHPGRPARPGDGRRRGCRWRAG